MCPKIPARQWLTPSFRNLRRVRIERKLEVKLRIFYLEEDDADPVTRSHLKNGFVMLNEVKHLSLACVRRDSSIAPLFQNDTRGVFEMASSNDFLQSLGNFIFFEIRFIHA